MADIGCGPGHVTAYLRDRGVDAFGIDLSPQLIAAAREANPGIRFDVGDMGALDVATGSLAGVLANYSIIHTPPDVLPAVLSEFSRVLAPGGHLLVSFQALADAEGTAEGFDHKVLACVAVLGWSCRRGARGGWGRRGCAAGGCSG